MLKLNNIERMRNVEKIMPLCLALFFCRTVFIGYKYLFFLTLAPCVVYSACYLLKNGIAKPKSGKVLLPLMVIALFFAHFAPLNNVVKESINLLLLLYFVAFADLYFAGEKTEAFLKWIVRFTVLAGVIAIIRFLLSMFDVQIPLSNLIFEGFGFALVNDGNFYSLFFIFSVMVSGMLFLRQRITSFSAFTNVLISIVNIGMSVSRRGYVLYAIFLLLMAIICISNIKYRKILVINISLLLVCICGFIVTYVFFNGLYTPIMPYNQKYKYYKLNTFVDKESSFREFDIKHIRSYYAYEKQSDRSNLFWVEDLKKSKSWGYMLGPKDDFKFNLVEEKDNYTIKLQRSVGYGEFQVWYMGRPIMYYKNVNYEISFAYRILQGSEKPFNVGWWVDDGQGYINNLPQVITPIDSVWKKCKVSYKFNKDYINPTCFLNSLQAGSTIEVKDISLTCDDTTGLPMYADQLPDSVIHSFFAKEGTDTINYLTYTRTDRWRYALELWRTRYDTKQKIFGQGFKYLEWYGDKFYGNPKRYDFPHNPIISSFLYSGIIGGVVYIIFLIMSLWLYWKKRQQLGIFFIMYLCCMFFSMFSGSSHFSFPLFAFLSFLPFLEYKSEEKAEKANVIQG